MYSREGDDEAVSADLLARSERESAHLNARAAAQRDAAYSDQAAGGLPYLKTKQLSVWDAEEGACQGMLYKKGGSKGGLIKRRNWQLRRFLVDHKIGDTDNYTLQYFKGESTKRKGQLDLAGASVVAGTGMHKSTNVMWEFQIVGARKDVFEMYAENEEDRTEWMETLGYAIGIATKRDEWLADRGVKGSGVAARAADNALSQVERAGKASDSSARSQLAHHSFSSKITAAESKKERSEREAFEKKISGIGAADDRSDDEGEGKKTADPASMRAIASILGRIPGGRPRKLVGGNPTLRLDVDLASVPPGSAARAELTKAFADDVARAAGLQRASMVRVLAVRSAPAAGHLTLVEFALLGVSAEAPLEALEAQLDDPQSALRRGLVTCSVDPSYKQLRAGAVGAAAGGGGGGGAAGSGQRGDATPEAWWSPDARVQAVMNKYKDDAVARTSGDTPAGSGAAWMLVFLRHEGHTRPLRVLRPTLLRRHACVVWPNDVMRAVGITGSIQEVWMAPSALYLVGAEEGAAPVRFEPTERFGGFPVLDSTNLIENEVYDLECDDRRAEAFEGLSDEQKAQIADDFERYDTNNDGTVDKAECAAMCDDRRDTAAAAIEQQYSDFVAQANRNGDLAGAERARAVRDANLQRIDDAAAQLRAMFEAADIDGDGSLSKPEFALAEAWWMRTALDPSKVAIFGLE